MIFSFLFSPWALLLIPTLYWLLPFVRNKTLVDIPGPWLAKFSSLWLLLQCRQARRFQAVDQAHKHYGKLVRIQPDHVSVADEDAIHTIYGHGNGFLKAPFYDAFVGLGNVRGLFNTRDRAEHTRKRKIVSNTFAPNSVRQFEPYIDQNVTQFVKQWDRISTTADATGYAQIDALHWFNYLAFDVIGDLAFGAPFGMLEKGADVAEIRDSPDAPPKYAPAVEVLNRRGEVSATVGCMPWIKPFAAYLPDPFFYQGMQAIKDLAGIAIARVKGRLEAAAEGSGDMERKDLLARLMEGKDESGGPMGRAELTSEALTQLIAGSDTTSNSMCALLFHVARTPHVLPKLRVELDAALRDDVAIPEYEQLRDLPYLDAVIKETLRIHSTSSLGLPRLVPPGSAGVALAGRHFPAGTVLSVPAYTIHHSRAIWGADADDYVPERWEKDRLTDRQKKAFVPFSYGPRACVGQNVATMELAIFVATIFRRYDFDLRQQQLETREGFLRKPVGLNVGLRRRQDQKSG